MYPVTTIGNIEGNDPPPSSPPPSSPPAVIDGLQLLTVVAGTLVVGAVAFWAWERFRK